MADERSYRILERHLAAAESAIADASSADSRETNGSRDETSQSLTIFDSLDMSKTAGKGKNGKKLKKLQARLGELGRKAREQGQSTVLVFEGPDAAGKGGAIRRTVWSLDARTYRIYQFAAPTDVERQYHYLWGSS